MSFLAESKIDTSASRLTALETMTRNGGSVTRASRGEPRARCFMTSSSNSSFETSNTARAMTMKPIASSKAVTRRSWSLKAFRRRKWRCPSCKG